MRIYLGNDMYLNSDKFCCWVTEEKMVKPTRGKSTEEYLQSRRVSGYCNNITDVLNSTVQRKLKGSDCTTMKELKALETELRSFIEEATANIKEGVLDKNDA